MLEEARSHPPVTMNLPLATNLPIEPVIPELLARLRAGPNAVLQAPPGAGKTTRVPLALLDQPWAAGKRIIVLEPRRLAARAAAWRMAEMLNEPIGATVGYRVRMESKVSARTRIEVVTDGLFLRRLQSDPALSDCAAVLFDEFHERGLETDLALALCREAQTALREDLRLVAMSATLEGGPVAKLLGDAPIVSSEGRAFPVEIRWAEAAPKGRIEDAVAATIRRALTEDSGSLLVFLPGVGEIRRVQQALNESGLGSGVALAPLYGDLTLAEQDRAIQPAPPGTRKIVLATSIAETSLTIEGIRVVIDSGLSRTVRFSAVHGMPRLETVRVSQAAAEQRRGRAGRLEPGVCYRLWTRESHGALARFDAPEILNADLAPLALELAAWGAREPDKLAWLDPPPAAALAQARALLQSLGALDAAGAVTEHGRAMASLGLHPRLAGLLLQARDMRLGALACDVAALVEERDILRRTGTIAAPRDADLRFRLDLLREGGAPASGTALDRGAVERVKRLAAQWRRQLGIKGDASNSQAAGRLLALAYPDRVAQRRAGSIGQFLLANGRGASLPESDPLAASDWLAVADLDVGGASARIYLAAPLTLTEIEDDFGDRIATEDVVAWDRRQQAVSAVRRRRFGALILAERRLDDADPERIAAELIRGIRELGPGCLPWNEAILNLRQRVAFLRCHEPESGWPDWSDDALVTGLEDWLGPWLNGITRITQVAKADLEAALLAQLDHAQGRALARAAPTHVAVPSGSRLAIDYADPAAPVLAVRLQEMFGAADTPRIAGGRVPLTLHLLSPARRPVQVTRDLKSFWANTYAQVKADLKGRYPKHYWPDNPLQAEPTARVRPKGKG